MLKNYTQETREPSFKITQTFKQRSKLEISYSQMTVIVIR